MVDRSKTPPPVRDGSDRGNQANQRSEAGAKAPAAGADAARPTPNSQRSFARKTHWLIVGRLQAHGQATYQFRPDQDLSYFAKVLTADGVRVLWGKDLERAIGAGATKPQLGDLIGARRIGREAVTLVDRRRDADGKVVTQSEHHAHRTRWEVEKLPFFSQRARQARLARDALVDARQAVRERPELRSTFLSLRAAEQLAAKRIRNPEDRERFLAMVREAISASHQRGEPLPDINLRPKSRAARTQTATPPPKRGRDEPTR
jgi:hypothetical protein